MGTTLWVLSRNKMTEGDDWDHSVLFGAAEKLDPLCERLGVKKFTSFLDWTDFNAAEDEEFPSEDELKKRASWFAPQDALQTLRALRDRLATNDHERKQLFEDDLQHLSDCILEELDDCITKVEKIGADGDVFHLCVVM
jgi:hypothetical protein